MTEAVAEPLMQRLATLEDVPRASTIGSWFHRHERRILGVIGLAIFLGAWQAGSDSGALDRLIFSSPAGVIREAADQVQLPRFWSDVGVTSFEVLVGSVLALATSIPLGLIIGWYRRVGFTADPWLNFFNSLPRIAFLPVLVLWLGLGIEPKIAAVFLGGFFSVIVPTAQGVKTVDRQLLDVGRSFRASQQRIFSSIVLPATVPYIISGIQVGISRALLGVIVAEIFNMTTGLGVMIHKASDNLNGDRMWFGILIFTVVGVGLSSAVGLLERHFQRWRPGVNVGDTR